MLMLMLKLIKNVVKSHNQDETTEKRVNDAMGITGFDGRPVTRGSKGSKLDSRASDDDVPDDDSPTMDIGSNLKECPSLGETGGVGRRIWVPLGSRKENPGQGN
jgi:hypothetical protein